MTECRRKLLHVLADEWFIGPGFEQDAIPYIFHFSPRRRTPTEHRHRLALRWIMNCEAQMPKRTPAGVDVSFHADVDREARRYQALREPSMAVDNLFLRIEYRARQRKFDL